MHEHSRGMCLLQRRYHRPFSIHPIPVLCLNRPTRRSRLQHQAPFQVVRLDRQQVKSPRIQPLGMSERHQPQTRTRSIITEAASRESRGLIIAALRLVFVSLLRNRPRSTGRRSYGGPAFMIMQLAILGVGVPGMGDMGDLPDITGTEDDPLRSRARIAPCVRR